MPTLKETKPTRYKPKQNKPAELAKKLLRPRHPNVHPRKNAQAGRKRYRRVRRMRPTVVWLVFLAPLGILALERYLDAVISLDDVKDVYYDQMGIDPWQVVPSPNERLGPAPDIQNLTNRPIRQCPNGQPRILSLHRPESQLPGRQRIPPMVHQTSKSSCVTRNFHRACLQWALPRWSYYLHDEEAVHSLIHSKIPEFPLLKLVFDTCATSYPLKLGLWRYLVLWEYGGVFSSLENYRSTFDATTLDDHDDGFFLLDSTSTSLSTELMAVSPRHPLMFYAVQHSINNIIQMKSGQHYSAGETVGEGALQRALHDFYYPEPNIVGSVPLQKGSSLEVGTLRGVHNRTIRIAGQLNGPEDFVTPIFGGEMGRKNEYNKMGLKLDDEKEQEQACFRQILSRLEG